MELEMLEHDIWLMDCDITYGQVHPLVWRIELFFVGLQMIGLCLSQITLIPQLKQIILQKFQRNRVIPLNTVVTRSIPLKQYITTR
ncbi:unnamed protein product [Adineta steineri]|uniref:Uncharacterized protein n=1 Tax=Adineta steineri TaxID=433720 RepID=A0A813ZK92_9BILA|nr:unnamed protein product [Adineta steineri]